jgi:glycosyltransferase involved in cell wall biosynthesis
MRIIITANTSWYLFNFRLRLAKELALKGHNIFFVAPRDDYSKRLSKVGKFVEVKIKSTTMNPLYDILTLIQYSLIFSKIGPHVLLSFTIKPNIYATFVSKVWKIKAISNISGLGNLFINESMATRIVRILYTVSIRQARKVFFQNHDDFDLFIAKSILSGAERTEILPGSGVDIQKFSPKSKYKDDGKFRFILIARLLWDKGVGEYAKAAMLLKDKYPNVIFQLLGFTDVDNPSAISTDQINEWVRNGAIEYLGVSDDVKEIIAESDCVVLPSYYREGVPRSLLEAASMAKPIITTNSVGCREVVEDGKNGFLVRVRDTHDLVLKMKQVLTLSRESQLELGLYGRRKMIEQFDEKIVIKSYMDAIENN